MDQRLTESDLNDAALGELPKLIPGERFLHVSPFHRRVWFALVRIGANLFACKPSD
jgi:hypothetical protein